MSAHIYKKFFLASLLLSILPVFVFAQTALVNINTASITELKTLNGIGDVKAQAIVDYRTQNGAFAKIEDIMNVSGIGTATFNNIKDFITVGANSTPNTQTDTTVQSVTTTTADQTNASGAKAYWITGNKSPEYEISIGKDRASVVGTPLEFEAETNFGYAKNNIFEWKFGDGSMAYGPSVVHSYSYPGEYVVVLRTKLPKEELSVRINVKVFAPTLLVSLATNERIEISNNSQVEVDLYGRALAVDGKTYSFPKDTIILPGQKISFLNSITGLTPGSINDTYLLTIGDNPLSSINSVSKVEDMRLKQVSLIQDKLSTLKLKLASMQTYSAPQVAKAEVEPDETIQETIDPTTITGNVLLGVESNEGLGWFAKLKKFFLRKE